MHITALTLASELALTSDVKLTVHEAMSGIFASISLVSWTLFLVPQLLENRRNQSGDAVSISFILIRLASDICNLLGGILAHILPGLVAVAGSYCVTDILLITQVLYYGIRNRRIEGKPGLAATIEVFKGNLKPVDGESTEMFSDDEALQREDHLATNHESDENTSLLRQRTRQAKLRSVSAQESNRALENPIDQLTEAMDEQGAQLTTRMWLKHTGIVLMMSALSTAGWFVAYQIGLWEPRPDEGEGATIESAKTIFQASQILGYGSAVLSLCCRIPQIFKNYRNKSCDGLSLLFFILSLVGNLTYGASIISHSVEKAYMIKNTPWLVGSLGTIVQDIVIFLQFYFYRKPSQ